MRTVAWLIAIGSASTMFAQSPRLDVPVPPIYEARVISVSGQVTRIRDGQPWAVSAGDRIPVQQVITSGRDGYARFEVAGGSSFEMFAGSRITFRRNTANENDLLDVIGGRVRIHLQPAIGQLQQRVFCPVAIITAHEPADIALAVDEDENVRIDVIEGAVRVQHAFLPRSEPVLVTAVDAILVQKDQHISRQLDRGSLYRYTVKPLKGVLSAITFGHAAGHSGPIEAPGSSKFLALASSSPLAQSSGR
jgi:hypothetical protein